MLKPQLHHQSSQSTKTLIPWSTKPFISGEILAAFPYILNKNNLNQNQKKNFRVHYNAANSTKAVLSSTEKVTGVKAVVTVQKTVGGAFANVGLTRGADDIGDLLGKTLLLWIVAAELDHKTGFEKPSMKAFAHRIRDVDGDTHYEADFEIPEDFGEVGAVLLENEHHKEMYVKTIVTDGFPHGTVHVTCNSWVHSKFNNPEKRIFFTNKVVRSTKKIKRGTYSQLQFIH